MRLGMINSPEDRLGIVSGWPTTRPEHRFSLPTPPFRGLFTGTFEQLIVNSGFVLVLFSALAVASVMVLRWRRPELHLPFRVPLYPYTPLLFVGFSLWILLYTLQGRPVESLLGLATVLLGLPLYFYWRRLSRR